MPMRFRSVVTVLIAAGARVKLEVAFDVSDEPDFLGRLAVDVLGYGPDHDVLFCAKVLVNVAKNQGGIAP